MKKITAIIFALVLAFSLMPTSAFAVGALPQPDSYDYGLPQPDSYFTGSDSESGWSSGANSSASDYIESSSVAKPVISFQPADINGSIGGVPGALSVSAYTNSSSTLYYQWYAVDVAGLSAYTAIPGATGATYTPSQTAGTTYYCVGVYAVAGNYRSAVVMSNVVAVTYSGIEIISMPTRTGYTVGESISLKGLVVRVYDADGSYWDSYDGNGLSMYPAKAETTGQVVVELNYGMSSASYYISVSGGSADKSGSTDAAGTDADGENAEVDADHVHEYDDWIVTKAANCVTTGLRSHTCKGCGDTQTEVVPKSDHTWDEGVITKQPTETSNGSRLYTCTVCKANKSEIIAAGTDTTGQQTGLTVGAVTPAPTANNSGTVGGNSDVAGVGIDGGDNKGVVNKDADSSGWWLIPVSALVLVGCGTGAYYLMKKKGEE